MQNKKPKQTKKDQTRFNPSAASCLQREETKCLIQPQQLEGVEINFGYSFPIAIVSPSPLFFHREE